MAKFALTFDKGRNNVDAETSLDNGFLTECSGFIYMPDSTMLQKIPGLTEIGQDLPSGATNANTRGIVALKFRNHSYMLAATQGKLSGASFSEELAQGDGTNLGNPEDVTTGGDFDSNQSLDTLSAFADIQDQQGTPVDFAFGGPYIKAVPDGRNRWIVWSGAEDERPLIFDEDLRGRFLSLRKPDALEFLTPGTPSSSILTTAGTIILPDTNNTSFSGRFAAGDFTWMKKAIRENPAIAFPSAGSGLQLLALLAATGNWIAAIMPTVNVLNPDSLWDSFFFTAYYPIRTENGYYVTTHGTVDPLQPADVQRQNVLPNTGGSDGYARAVIGPYRHSSQGDPDEAIRDASAFSADPETAYDGNTTTYTEKTTVASTDNGLTELTGKQYTDRLQNFNATYNGTFDGVQDTTRAKRFVVVTQEFAGTVDPNQLGPPPLWWIRYAALLNAYSVEYSYSVGHGNAADLIQDHLLLLDLEGVVNGSPGITPTSENPNPYGTGPGSFKGEVRVEISRDSGTAGSFQTVLREHVGYIPRTQFQIDLSTLTGVDGTDALSELVIRITFVNSDPLNSDDSGIRIYQVGVRVDTAGASSGIAQGTYHYCHTEVLSKILSDGTSFEVESAPSARISLDITDDVSTGIKLTIPARKNVESMGIANDADTGMKVKYRVYRSTKSGSYPDLGFIYEMDAPAAVADTVTFIDNFDTGESTLSTPTLNTVTAGTQTVDAAGEAPPIRDATLFRGSLVVIPSNAPYELVWTIPGAADYFPNPVQRLKLLPSERNDQLVGVVNLNDVLVVFLRTRTLRLRELPFAGLSDYNLTRIERDTLSPNEGLAGTPKSYCTFELQDGRSMVAWVSHSGIWMTDGSLVTERGMGCVKLSRFMDWNRTIDPARLSSAELTYDPQLQAIFFDYQDKNGVQQLVIFHTATLHWIQSGQDQVVPKWTGPHPTTYSAYGRAILELNGILRHYTVLGGNVYRMSRGIQAAGSDILSVARTGFVYPGGQDGTFHIYDGTLEHTKWAKSDQGTLEILTRDDESGTIQTVRIDSVSLGQGPRMSNVYINRRGQCVQVTLRHDGPTTSFGDPLKGIKTLLLDGEFSGDTTEG